MGGLISRWRKAPSTKELLTTLQSEMSELQSVNSKTQQRQRRILGYFTAYSIAFYLILAIVVYLKYFRHPDYADFFSQAKLAAPFLVSPLILMLLQRVLSWWYRRQLVRNDVRLKELREKKRRLLDEVMEKETYKVAKEILEKFAPEQLSRPSLLSSASLVKPLSSSLSASTSDLRRRRPESDNEGGNELNRPNDNRSNNRSSSVVASNFGANKPWLKTPTAGSSATTLQRSSSGSMPALNANPDLPISSRNAARKRQWLMQQDMPSSGLTPTATRPMKPPTSHNGPHPVALPNQTPSNTPIPRHATPRGPPLPRPILPRDRGYMDRLVEYLVGDGPSNRYALICKRCQSHNGMALKEEFEYVAFRCCYCFYWNPARKQKPMAPRLQFNNASDQHSSSDSEGEEKGVTSTPESDAGKSTTAAATEEESEEAAESATDDPSGSKGADDEAVATSQLFTSVLDADDEKKTDDEEN